MIRYIASIILHFIGLTPLWIIVIITNKRYRLPIITYVLMDNYREDK